MSAWIWMLRMSLFPGQATACLELVYVHTWPRLALCFGLES